MFSKGAMCDGRETDGKLRWVGAAFGSDEAEPRSEERERIYAKCGYTVELVFGETKQDGRKPSMDLRSSMKVRWGFSLMCLVHNVKKIVKKVLERTVSLPGKYGKLTEDGVLGYREQQLTLAGTEV